MKLRVEVNILWLREPIVVLIHGVPERRLILRALFAPTRTAPSSESVLALPFEMQDEQPARKSLRRSPTPRAEPPHVCDTAVHEDDGVHIRGGESVGTEPPATPYVEKRIKMGTVWTTGEYSIDDAFLGFTCDKTFRPKQDARTKQKRASLRFKEHGFEKSFSSPQLSIWLARMGKKLADDPAADRQTGRSS
jgi:hypothetical protein